MRLPEQKANQHADSPYKTPTLIRLRLPELEMYLPELEQLSKR